MKKTKDRSIIIYFLVISFFIGMSLFLGKMFIHAKDWAMSPINTHLSGSEFENAGKILDRNDVILAQSVDGERRYNDDAATRKAMLHVVGDDSINITTAIQNVFTADLFGYNIVTGIGAPEYFNTSKDIKLTLDSSICKVASEQLGSRKGAVCVYNYKTGEILCMTSRPTYDPYNKPDLSDSSNEAYSGAYLNRVLSSSFTPGSTFKIITSAAAIDNTSDIYTRNFNCQGKEIVGGEKITCMEYHGNINFKDAMAQSCNIVFADIAMELQKDKMTQEAEAMGFNQAMEVDGIKVSESHYDVSKASEADLGWSGIGQQNDLVNPFHMMKIMGAIANNGTPVEPYMIDSMSVYKGINTYTAKTKDSEQMLSESTAQKLKELMRYTVETNYGNSMFSGLTVCAKTGTAEVGEGKKPHGWIVGFSTDEKCPVAFVVVVENSGYGYTQAGPIATAVLKATKASMEK